MENANNGSASSPLKKWDEDFKKHAVQYVLKEGLKIGEAALNLGVPKGTLGTWVAEHRRAQSAESRAHREQLREKKALTAEQLADKQRIRELERQVHRLTQERAILKKAMAYCIDLPK